MSRNPTPKHFQQEDPMKNITLLALALFLPACSAAPSPAMCLGTDVTPFPGEPLRDAESACGGIQNIAETVFIDIGCDYPARPDFLAACPYRSFGETPVPEHLWQDCVALIRTAVTCEEVIELERFCYCEGR